MELESTETYEYPAGNAVFYGAPLSPREITKLSKKHTTTTFKRGVPIEKSDDAAFGLELFQRTITGWKGLTRKGEELECSDENKKWLYDRHGDLATDAMEGLDEARKKAREAQEKNSNPSQKAK